MELPRRRRNPGEARLSHVLFQDYFRESNDFRRDPPYFNIPDHDLVEEQET